MCLKKLIDKTNKKLKKLVWYDMSLIKLTTAAFFLMIAKLWSPILALDWYWYLVIAIFAGVVPFKKIFMK